MRKQVKLASRVGERFGRLLVIGDAPPSVTERRNYRRLLCRCDCGDESSYLLSSLRSKHTTSCGCFQRETKTTHGMSKTNTYRIWWGMMCRGKGFTSKKNYVDRGIDVCERWHTFENFLEDMGERPGRLTIERVDNMKGYGPDNCKWADYLEQGRNRRTNVKFEYRGRMVCRAELSQISGISTNALKHRINVRGMTPEQAVETPLQQGSQLSSFRQHPGA